MTNKPDTKGKTKPKWVVQTITFNLSKTHADMLTALVLKEKEADSRSTITTTLAKAIERAYNA